MKYSNDVAMTWKMKWLNRSVATINATLQLLDIYRFIYLTSKEVVTKTQSRY